MPRRVRVFQHSSTLLAGHVRNLLEGAGVACELRNWTLSGGMGELAPLDCEPQLWVASSDAPRAQEIIEQWRQNVEAPSLPGARLARGWRCQRCGEWHESNFDTCWQCGLSRPDI